MLSTVHGHQKTLNTVMQDMVTMEVPVIQQL
jgi:hypothetical protein